MSYPKTWSPRRVIATAGIAAVAVSLAFAVPQLVSSQAARRQANLANRMQERGIPYGQADALEVYRDQYVAILTNLHEVSTIYGGNAPSQGEMSLSNAQASAQQAIQVVRDLTAEELSVMMQTLPDITPLLYDTVDLVTIARADRATQLGLTLGGPTRTSIGTPGENFASSGFPNAPYSSEVGSTRPTTAATLAASATFETAEGVREGASRACDETIVAIGAGGNTSLVCIAADLVWITSKIVFWGIQFESDDIDSAEINGTYLRTGHLHTDIESLQGSLDSHDANIDADLANHNSNIQNRITTHDLNIDADLSAHDANIDSDLAAHDANIDGDLMVHDIAVQSQLGGIQGTLDNEIEKQQVHMQVMTVVNRSRYLVLTTEAGKPVDVSFGDVETYNAVTRSCEKLSGTSITQIETGIYEVGMYLGPLSSDKIFRLNVTHDDVVDHFGQIVFHRDTL